MPGEGQGAGIRGEDMQVPLIFYVGQAEPSVPKGAQGLTSRPDRLVALVLDALPPRVT